MYAQTVTLNGYVTDAKTRERLIGASIVEKNSLKGTVTNAYGFFSLTITPHDSIILIASYIGYSPEIINISSPNTNTINIALEAGITLEGIEVKTSRIVPIEQRNEMSVNEISSKEIKMLPVLGGEPDLLKAFQLMPGISGGSEGSSAIYVRGGSPDQNLIILDDVPLYYIDHLGGFVSTFNSDAINNVRLIKGGFPARYGGRLSSVVDIRMKDGNATQHRGNISAGMIVTKAFLEGPIKQDSTSYMISIRRFMYDLITRPLSKMLFDGISIGYYFYDINAKLNHKLSDLDHLYISLYAGDDKFGWSFKDADQYDYSLSKEKVLWGNKVGSVRWNHQFNSKLFSNMVVYLTQYKYEVNQLNEKNNESFNSQFSSGIQDVSIKYDFEHTASPNYKCNLGASAIYHTFSPGVTQYKLTEMALHQDTLLGAPKTYAWEPSVYAENEFKLNNKVSFNIGIRAQSYIVNRKKYFSFEPRAFCNLRTGKESSVKISYSSMQQNVHLLTSTGAGMPTDLWVPATHNVRPSISKQIAIGYAQTLSKKAFELNIEVYYKTMSNLIAYQSGASYLGTSLDWQDKVEKEGNGLSYGFEILLQKKNGDITGWISYTLSKTTRQFANLNEGIAFPYKYDHRHELGFVLFYKLKENIDFSATWMFHTGNAFTLANGKYNIISDPDPLPAWNNGTEEIHIYPGINTFRYKCFHKLDIGMNFYKKKKKGLRTWSIGIYNVYNRQNPFFYFYQQERFYDIVGNYNPNLSKVKLMQLSQFPFMPSISYSIDF